MEEFLGVGFLYIFLSRLHPANMCSAGSESDALRPRRASWVMPKGAVSGCPTAPLVRSGLGGYFCLEW